MPQLLQERDFRDSDTEPYPRPQLRRTQWTCLDGPWDFRFAEDPPRFAVPGLPAPVLVHQ